MRKSVDKRADDRSGENVKLPILPAKPATEAVDRAFEHTSIAGAGHDVVLARIGSDVDERRLPRYRSRKQPERTGVDRVAAAAVLRIKQAAACDAGSVGRPRPRRGTHPTHQRFEPVEARQNWRNSPLDSRSPAGCGS